MNIHIFRSFSTAFWFFKSAICCKNRCRTCSPYAVPHWQGASKSDSARRCHSWVTTTAVRSPALFATAEDDVAPAILTCINMYYNVKPWRMIQDL